MLIKMDTSSSKKIKLSVKPEEDMQKPLSKINEDLEHYRTMFSGPIVYREYLKHINPQEAKAIDWERKGVVPKPGNALANYKPSAIAIATAERERVAKRTIEEAFNKVFALKSQLGNSKLFSTF